MRSLIGLGALLGTYLCVSFPFPAISCVAMTGFGHKILRTIGFSLQKDGYTHIQGNAAEKILDPNGPQLKLMCWNICGVGGGMSLDHGGVIGWRSRIDRIVEKIKHEDPDVLVLEEIYDTALAEAIVERLKSNYAHFFTHLGANIWGSESGCMVLSKCNVHRFSYTPFSNNDWTLNRGIASLEIKASPDSAIPCARIIGTHLIHGDGDQAQNLRATQVAQIVDQLSHETIALPTMIAGDLNIERDQEEGTLLSTYLNHTYQEKKPTCTNRLVAQWDLQTKSVWGETIDYISFFKRTFPNGQELPAVDDSISWNNPHLIHAYDETYNTKTALSDHHGVAVTISLPQKPSV